MEYKLYQFFKSPRVIAGLLAWMFSHSVDASEVNNLVGISSDNNPTNYLLSKVKCIEESAEETENKLSVVSKKNKKDDPYKKLIYPSVTTTVCGVDVPNVYVFPNPVYKTLYISGVDENDTHLTIYDMDGNYLLSEYGNEIEVVFLPPGTYILGVNDYFVKYLKLL